MEEKIQKLKEEGNYRIAEIHKIKRANDNRILEVIVRCNFDGLLLLITDTYVPMNDLSIEHICQVYRTSNDGCCLIHYMRKAEC